MEVETAAMEPVWWGQSGGESQRSQDGGGGLVVICESSVILYSDVKAERRVGSKHWWIRRVAELMMKVGD